MKKTHSTTYKSSLKTNITQYQSHILNMFCHLQVYMLVKPRYINIYPVAKNLHCIYIYIYIYHLYMCIQIILKILGFILLSFHIVYNYVTPAKSFSHSAIPRYLSTQIWLIYRLMVYMHLLKYFEALQFVNRFDNKKIQTFYPGWKRVNNG